MSLPLFQTQIRELQMLETRWKSEIDPVLANPILQGRQINNISLSIGNNTINHLLDRPYQGYFITGMHNSFAQIYDTTSPMPSKTLILNASAVTSVDLWVY